MDAEDAFSAVITAITPPPTNTNTSASSNDDQPYSSTELRSKRSPSEITDKSEKSESSYPKTDKLPNGQQSKAISYQDIHSEYTKRRYKHVESKVGHYIASIREQERKRRATKFQRHSSMPSTAITPMIPMQPIAKARTIGRTGIVRQQTFDNLVDAMSLQQMMSYSSTELFKLKEAVGSDIEHDVDVDADGDGDNDADPDGVEVNMNGMTSSAYSSNSNGGGVSSCTSAGTNSISRHESSDDAVLIGTDFIDKHIYSQIIDERDFLQQELDENKSENGRLKRNIEYLRIELSNAQAKNKRLNTCSNCNLNMRWSHFGGSYQSGFSRNSLERQSQSSMSTKSTQTEFVPEYVGLRTPVAALKHEAGGGIEAGNILRQRTNSFNSAQKTKLPITGSVSNKNRPTYVNSPNTGYESRSLDTFTPTRTRARKMCLTSFSSPDASPKSTPSPRASLPNQQSRQLRPGEYGYSNDRHPVRYAPVPTNNTSDDSDTAFDHSVDHLEMGVYRRSQKRRSRSLRHRFLHFFGRCTRCDDPQEHDETVGNAAVQMAPNLSRGPLLNRPVR